MQPADVDVSFFETLKRGGFNRISMGMQSANEAELKILGRRHTAGNRAEADEAARKAGIDNVSVDLMLGLPNSSLETLKSSIDFCAALEADHVSAYILKIEPGTPFAKQELNLPDEDGTADQYLFAVNELKSTGTTSMRSAILRGRAKRADTICSIGGAGNIWGSSRGALLYGGQAILFPTRFRGLFKRQCARRRRRGRRFFGICDAVASADRGAAKKDLRDTI